MIEQVEHIKKFALQDNSALTVKQFGEAIARMCDDAIREAVEQPLAPDVATVCPEHGEPVSNLIHFACGCFVTRPAGKADR